jgi:outer membrane protein OmpA-like peptidoglycan-associated protein
MRTAKYILILIAYFTLNSVYLFSQTSINHIESVKEIKAINTKGEESNPIIAPGGNKMYFMHMSSNKKKASILGQEIWTSEKIEGEWSNATPWQISSNDNANNVIIGVTNNEKRLYLFNSNDTRNKFAKGLSYVQLNEGGVFDSPIGTSIPEFEIAYGFYSFYVTPDEEQFFVATTADSSDYEDLFVSLKQEDGSWGELINLGSTINTSFIETTPFLSADKKVLYFSSDGHDGFGSADLFKSERIGDGWTNWTPPENLGENINSKGFDASYVVLDEWTAMFSSNRNRTFSDIYEVTFARENQTIALIVSADTNILEGRISLAKLDTTSTAPIKLLVKDHLGVVVDTIYADYKGKFTYKKLTTSKYTISLMDGNDTEMIDISIADLLASSEAAITSTEPTVKAVEAYKVEAAADKSESPLLKSMETVCDSLSKGSIVQQISKRLETQGNSVDLKEAASLSRIEGNSSEDLEEECLELLVYFDFDSYSISDIGIHQIDKYIEGLELVKGSILIITGHTDSDGPSAYNNILGERRANAVKEHFIQKGIIVNYDVTSKGEEEPMALNSTEQGRKSNRRVSVTISKNGTKKIPA